MARGTQRLQVVIVVRAPEYLRDDVIDLGRCTCAAPRLHLARVVIAFKYSCAYRVPFPPRGFIRSTSILTRVCPLTSCAASTRR